MGAGMWVTSLIVTRQLMLPGGLAFGLEHSTIRGIVCIRMSDQTQAPQTAAGREPPARLVILVVPTGPGTGLTSVSLGLLRALQRLRHRVAFAKPIAQVRADYSGPERSTTLAALALGRPVPVPMTQSAAEALLGSGDEQRLLEEVVAGTEAAFADADVLIVEGLVPDAVTTYALSLNAQLAKALDARVVVATGAKERTPAQVVEAVELTLSALAARPGQVLGVVVNRVAAPEVLREAPAALLLRDSPLPPLERALRASFAEAFSALGAPVLGLIPQAPVLEAPRISDVAAALGARSLVDGDTDRRVMGFSVAAMTVPNAMNGLVPGNLVVTPGDRLDIIMAVALAAHSGVQIAGLLLSGGLTPDPKVMHLCARAFETGLPVLTVAGNTLTTAQRIMNMDREVPIDDRVRAEGVMNTVADALDLDLLEGSLAAPRDPHLSPPAFRHWLIAQARRARRRIILPEATEPRTLAAASMCAHRHIAECVLLGDPDKIRAAAARHHVTLGEGIEIVDAAAERSKYVPSLVKLRESRGMTPELAEEALRDEVVLATLMLKEGVVDGLVSGATHTTADTIRPALQLIKTAPDARLVSSVFFMCLPEQVLVYGDCAVNPNPSAEELADIALQSARSAELFGITPRVAMISYSTGTSGTGANVEKVRDATALVRKARPGLVIDGPLQYDAAFDPSVAASKAPNSPVAGRATVFVFPDLNTGNTTYKAVQRSARVVSIGPMLQGLAKPVNDLSRGALVDDIVFTIALTAIQASGSAGS